MCPYVHSSTIHNSWDMGEANCPSTDKWIKKMWYIYTMEYYSDIKREWNNAICSNTAQLEIITLNQREEQTLHDTKHMWNLKYGTNKPSCKTETVSQTQRTDMWLPKGRCGRGMAWEFGVGRCQLSHLEWISNKSYCIEQRTIPNLLG